MERQIPVFDRTGFLVFLVEFVKSSPAKLQRVRMMSGLWWSNPLVLTPPNTCAPQALDNAIQKLTLRDPATEQVFPPLPRTAFPAEAFVEHDHDARKAKANDRLMAAKDRFDHTIRRAAKKRKQAEKLLQVRHCKFPLPRVSGRALMW